MKTSDATLQAVLYDSPTMVAADMVEVELAVATQYWTTASASITFGGQTYSTQAPAISHGSIRSPRGGEIGTCDLRFSGSFSISGSTIAQRAMAGDFDGRKVRYRRAYMAAWGDTPTAIVDVFTGRVAETRFTSTGVELQLKTLLYRAGEQRPLRILSPTCGWLVYGTPCGVTKATHTASDTVASGSTTLDVVLTTGTSYAGPGGTVEFKSGALNGSSAVIRSYTSGTKTIRLVSPLSSAPAQSVSVDVVRGCQRDRTTCLNTFNNIARFGGFPDIPRVDK